MTRALTLADYASVEADGRAQFYPDMVRRGELSPDEAEHDWRCWVAIAEFFKGPADHPAFLNWGLTWGDLAEAAAKALRRREAALAANNKPELNGPLSDRRDAVAAIAWRLERRAKFFRETTAALQAAARARKQAKAAA